MFVSGHVSQSFTESSRRCPPTSTIRTWLAQVGTDGLTTLRTLRLECLYTVWGSYIMSSREHLNIIHPTEFDYLKIKSSNPGNYWHATPHMWHPMTLICIWPSNMTTRSDQNNTTSSLKNCLYSMYYKPLITHCYSLKCKYKGRNIRSDILEMLRTHSTANPQVSSTAWVSLSHIISSLG